MDVNELIARTEIQQQLTNYTIGVDFKDWDRFRTVFTADADIDYTNSTPLRGTPDEIVAVFEPTFAMIPWMQHFITNVDYDFQGDECTVRAFFYNPSQMPGHEGVSHHYGYYDHVFVKTADGWKSRSLVETMLNTINSASPDLPVVGSAHAGQS